MGIQVNNATSMPPIIYDKVHVVSLSITQPQLEHDNDDPIYHVVIDYIMYGVYDNIRFYSKEAPKRIDVPDYFGLAKQKAMAGDMTQAQCLGAIELAIAKLIEEQLNTTAVVV